MLWRHPREMWSWETAEVKPTGRGEERKKNSQGRECSFLDGELADWFYWKFQNDSLLLTLFVLMCWFLLSFYVLAALWEYASTAHPLYIKDKYRKDIPEISDDETFLFTQLLSSPSNCLMKARRTCNIWIFSPSKYYPTPLNLHHSFQICS